MIPDSSSVGFRRDYPRGLRLCKNSLTFACFFFFSFLQEEYRNSMPASSFQQQKLRVCEVCSAYLGLHDNDRRLADHFGGKLHLGFIQIREKLDQLRVIFVCFNPSCSSEDIQHLHSAHIEFFPESLYKSRNF